MIINMLYFLESGLHSDVLIEDAIAAVYDMYKELSDIQPDISNVIYKNEYIKKVFEEDMEDSLSIYLKDMNEQLGCLREAISFENHAADPRMTNNHSNNTEINNFELLKNIVKERDEQISVLKLSIAEVQTENHNMADKLSSERAMYEKKIALLNDDLEQQLEECIELNCKLDEISKAESRIKNELSNLINEVTLVPQNIGESMSEIVETLRNEIELVKLDAQNNKNQNRSDITVKGLEQEHQENMESVVSTNSDLLIKLNESLLAKEEDDRHIASLMLEISTLTSDLKSVSENLKKSEEHTKELNINEKLHGYVSENEELVIKLNDALLAKEDGDRQIASLMLEVSTLTSELKSIRESFNTSEESSKKLNEKLQNSVSDNANLSIKLNDALLAKEDGDRHIASLMQELSNLTSELKCVSESLNRSEEMSKKIENEKVLHENSSQALNSEIRNLKNSINQINVNFKSCSDMLESTKAEFEATKDRYLKIEYELKSEKEKNDSLVSENSRCADKCLEIEEQMYDILIENEQLKDNTNLKILEDEVNLLKCNFKNVSATADECALKLTYINCELEEANKAIIEKDNIIIERDSNLKSMEDKTASLEMEIGCLKTIESDVRCGWNDTQNQLDKLKVMYTSVYDERNSLATSADILTDDIQSLKGELDELSKGLRDKISENESKDETIESLQSEIKSIQSELQCKVDELNQNVVAQLKTQENEKNELKEKDFELEKLKVEFEAFKLKCSNMSELEALLKDTKEKLEVVEWKHEFCNNELKVLRANEIERAKEAHGADDFESKIKNMEFYLRGSESRIKLLQNDNEDLRNKANNSSITEFRWKCKWNNLQAEFKSYKDRCVLTYEDKDTLSHLQDELNKMRTELNTATSELNTATSELKTATKELNTTKSELKTAKEEVVEITNSYSQLGENYKELKERYLLKRQSTEKLEEAVDKYKKLEKWCKEKGIVMHQN